jgi:hypothetical protein
LRRIVGSFTFTDILVRSPHSLRLGMPQNWS